MAVKTLPVVLQLYTVRDLLEKDFEGTLRRVKEIGYDYVELAGLMGHEPAKLKSILDSHGLSAISAHVPINEFAGDIAAAVGKYKTVGCKFIAIPWLPAEAAPGGADFDKTLETIKKIGEACNAVGITLLYHNHDFEFKTKVDGLFGLDYLYKAIPAEILQTQIDTCWVKVAGQDPAAYIRKYAGRCPVVHLKDFYREGETKDMYELIGEDKKSGTEENKGLFEFRPVGHGVQDFPAILTASAESGAEWVVVEQDLSVGRTSLEAAKLSREYLRSLGW